MAAAPLTRPFTVRVLEGVPLPPAALGLGVGASYLALHVAFHFAAGRMDFVRMAQPNFWVRPGWWTEILNAVLLGYLVAIIRFGQRAAARDLDDLRPVLRCSAAEFAALRRGLTLFDERRLLVFTLMFMAGSGYVAFFDARVWYPGVRPPLSDPVFVWVACRQLLFGWMLGQAIGIDVALTRRFSRIGEDLVRVDLLDVRALSPLARHGLRTVLFYAVLSALVSLFFFTPSGAVAGNALLLLVFIGLAAEAFVLPVRGVHRSIRATKRRELDWLTSRIRADQLALRDEGSPAAREAALRLPALLASEARIRSVREWPFDISTLLRFALYVTLGVGSWVGGALVERLLGVALD